jgi:hypothetical protein
MIAFGFAIFQFFDSVDATRDMARPLWPDAPHVVALSLIAIGVLGLLAAMHEYKLMVRYLWSYEFKDFAGIAKAPRTTPVLGISMLLALVGICTFTALIYRLFR